EVGTAHIADEQRIAGQYHRRLGAAQGVHDQEGYQLRTVAGRMQDAEAQLSQLQLLVIGERAEQVGDSRRFVEAELASMLRDQAARAGDMIGMDLRIDYVSQSEAALAQQCIVLLRLDRRVDNRRVVRAARGYDVGGASTAFVQELLEIHQDHSGSLMSCLSSASLQQQVEPILPGWAAAGPRLQPPPEVTH